MNMCKTFCTFFAHLDVNLILLIARIKKFNTSVKFIVLIIEINFVHIRA